jgi:hypothetical protein
MYNAFNCSIENRWCLIVCMTVIHIWVKETVKYSILEITLPNKDDNNIFEGAFFHLC